MVFQPKKSKIPAGGMGVDDSGKGGGFSAGGGFGASPSIPQAAGGGFSAGGGFGASPSIPQAAGGGGGVQMGVSGGGFGASPSIPQAAGGIRSPLSASSASDFPDPLGYYKELGLTPSCSRNDIRKAFKEKAMKCHPDRARGNMEMAAAYTPEFQKLSAAYQVLSDSKLKKKYDETGQGTGFYSAEEFLKTMDATELFSDFFDEVVEKGPNMKEVVEITARQARSGVVAEVIVCRTVYVKGREAHEETKVQVNIPPGTKHKERVIVPGVGSMHPDDRKPPGDLVAIIYVN